LVVNTLLFIENREMLDPARPHRNPAIEWDRVSHAVAELSIHAVDRGPPDRRQHGLSVALRDSV
jgi:hypothetical protein